MLGHAAPHMQSRSPLCYYSCDACGTMQPCGYIQVQMAFINMQVQVALIDMQVQVALIEISKQAAEV